MKNINFMSSVPELSQLKENILGGKMAALSKAITLVESKKPEHRHIANKLLQELMPFTGKSLRIGITGIPGVGKSSFIESLGVYLISQGYRVAVLAIDPSSHISRGSILGDKTRMEHLAKYKEAFIRPSPASGTLGGISSSTFESVLLCESVGYNIILIETVGVGQSEITVAEICDCFLYLTLASTGDEFQGIKKGIMEMANVIFINKAEEEFSKEVIQAKNNLLKSLQLMPGKNPEWKIPVILGSALENKNIDSCWEQIEQFCFLMKKTGDFEENRKKQFIQRFEYLLFYYFMEKIKEKHQLYKQVEEIKSKVASLEINPSTAAEQWIDEIIKYK